MVHGINILGRYFGRVPVNQKLVINNYNNYSQRPLPLISGGGYPNCNDYYWGRDPYSSYYLTAGLFSFGLMLGNIGLGSLFGAVKKLFSKPNKHSNTTPTNTSTISGGKSVTPTVTVKSDKVTLPPEQNLVNQGLTPTQNVNEQNDENVYSSSVKTPINNMRSAKNSYDLLMAINDASMELSGLSESIIQKTNAFNDKYKEINGEDYISKTKEQENEVKNIQKDYNKYLQQENIAQANYNKVLSDVEQVKNYLKSINDDIAKIEEDLKKPLTDKTKKILEKNKETLETAKINAERDLKAKEKLLAEKENALNLAQANTRLANTILEKEKQTLKEMNAKKAEIEQMEKDRNKLDKTITNQQNRLIKLSKRENNKMYRKQVREIRNDNKAQEAANKGNIGKTNRKEGWQDIIQHNHIEIQNGHIDLYNFDN